MVVQKHFALAGISTKPCRVAQRSPGRRGECTVLYDIVPPLLSCDWVHWGEAAWLLGIVFRLYGRSSVFHTVTASLQTFLAWLSCESVSLAGTLV